MCFHLDNMCYNYIYYRLSPSQSYTESCMCLVFHFVYSVYIVASFFIGVGQCIRFMFVGVIVMSNCWRMEEGESIVMSTDVTGIGV